MSKAEMVYLLLADGTLYPGYSFGAAPDNRFGRLVFTTGMGGYLETLTDPAAADLIILHTFPEIGAYGVIDADLESQKAWPAGYCIRHIAEHPSNFRSQGTLAHYLTEQNIPGIQGLDTRALTRKLRSDGEMNAVITADPETVDLKELQAYKPVARLEEVSVKETRTFPAISDKQYAVAVIDTGTKQSLIRKLQARGCEVTLFPYLTDPKAILAGQPDGILIPNGPGHPQDYPELTQNLSIFKAKHVPLLAIGFGHLLFATAHEIPLTELGHPHRGGNQAVKDLANGKIYMTSQSHNLAVDSSELDPALAKVSFAHAHDGSCEGLDYTDKPQFSLQFAPEGAGGPEDTEFLLERFISYMEEK